MFGSAAAYQERIAGLERELAEVREQRNLLQHSNESLRLDLETARQELRSVQGERIAELKRLHDRSTGQYLFTDPPFDPAPAPPRSESPGATPADRLQALMRTESVFGSPTPETDEAAPDELGPEEVPALARNP